LPAAGRATARLQLPWLFEDFETEKGVPPWVRPKYVCLQWSLLAAGVAAALLTAAYLL
jgi:hypothetical protein